ncbi:MAG: zinc-dependent metalloprotease [Flavobacteriaceae bacterium]|nr:zinc-dependent metalloprotease [Flavobacteriaceae bacterium]MDG1962388.1 zinc-dependent metalloprotease [Flavobacteriaceae bacterium]
MNKFAHQCSLILFVLLCSAAFGQETDSISGANSIDALMVEYPKSSGFIDSYFDAEKGKLMWGVPDSILGRDLLMVTRFAQLPADYSGYINAGSKTAERIVRFEKSAGRLLLREHSFVNTADENDPIAQSVEANNFAPILAAFDLENDPEEDPDEAVFLIDVSDYFSEDSPGFNLVSEGNKKKYKIGRQDKSRSFIEKCRSFPQNVEVLHTLTFEVGKAPRGNRSGTFSFQINHSLVLLPEVPMQMRLTDHRVGWFSLKKIDYSSPALKSDDFEVAVRWRLEPKDVAAYNRGELVEPKKPIVFYLDPATPMKWRPYFRQGIEDWQATFESAGFKNAIIAKDPPSAEEDPDFSPEDVRYSTVRYVASTTRNAVGPSVKDPRSGEIIESDVIWYHNHLRSYRNRYLLETGAANPKARTLDTPEDEIGEMMRRVISHEVGHALGLPHNMKASAAYAVDSLRSGSFTQKMGIATTIMDYARYNYVAQPGDQNIRFVRQIGPYDHYAIEWGYRYFDGADIGQVADQLKSLVDAKSLDPIYMFGSRGNDPNAQTENIGDDPIRATNYGLKNLRIVAKNLDAWTTPQGATYGDLAELYGELIGVYRRYMQHVAAMVGGVYETRINKGQDALPYRPVPQTKQIEALSFLDQNLWQNPRWLLMPELAAQFSQEDWMDKVGGVQRSVVNRLLRVSQLNAMAAADESMIGDPLSVAQMLSEVQTSIFGVAPSDELTRNLQIYWIKRLQEVMAEDKLAPSVAGSLHQSLTKAQKHFKSRRSNGNDAARAHASYAYALLTQDQD